jgi:homoserine O-acetyltransferase
MPKSARMRRTIRPRWSRLFGADQPLKLDCGIDLAPFQIAYQTYGTLNAARSNAMLVCHALTGDQHVANIHPVTGKPGWWETMVGPGKPLDTDRYFVICSNVIGGCMGSTGPASTNPATGKLWGLDFRSSPSRHGARAGHADRSSRHRHAVLRGRRLDGRHAGAAMGGAYPERVFSRCRSPAAPGIRRRTSPSTRSAARRHGRSGLARRPLFRSRAPPASRPRASRAWPRISPICRTPRCTASSAAAAGPRRADLGLRRGFPGRSYLRHQGSSFVERFDANSYLYHHARDGLFRPRRRPWRRAGQAFRGIQTRFCVVSFTSDWLFPTSESRAIVHALNAAARGCRSPRSRPTSGHDAFLLDEPEFFDICAASWNPPAPRAA